MTPSTCNNLVVGPAGNPFLVRGRRPLVVGHRGVPRLHQENTLAGFRRAVALGVPAVELDVQLTRDGQAVVFHDHDLYRLTGQRGHIYELTWAQLSRLQIQRTLSVGVDADGRQVIVRYDQPEPIPLLAEVLAELGSQLAFNIELKLDPRRWWCADVGTRAGEVIAAAGVAAQVIITSFDPRKLAAAARGRPALTVGFCFDDSLLGGRRRLVTGVLETNLVQRVLGTRVVGAEHTLIGPTTIARLQSAGVAVGTYNLMPMATAPGKLGDPRASSPAEIARLAALGINWIETDDPVQVLTLLG